MMGSHANEQLVEAVRRRPGIARRKRLLVLSQYYHPEPNFITADVAQALAAQMDVVVVAAHANYPTGRFASGARWWRPVRTHEHGVTVWRLPLFPDHSLSPLRRAVNYLSFALCATIVAPFVAGRVDVVWVYQTPPTTALAALWFKLAHGARLALTYADLWPESFAASGVLAHGPAIRMVSGLRRWLNGLADLIICSTRGTRERFLADGVPDEKLQLVSVWVDGVPQELGSLASEPASPNLVYAGNLGPSQRLETLVVAAALLQREGVQVVVDVYGSGASDAALQALAASEGATNVRFHGRVAPSEAFAVSTTAFAQLVCLQPSPLFRMTIPSKLAFAFAAGAPVLYGLEGEAAAIARDSGGAVAFDADDPASLARAVKTLLSTSVTERDAMRVRLRNYYCAHFAKGELISRYVGLLGSGPAVRETQPTARERDAESTVTR